MVMFDVVEEILSRSLVTDVLRCKSVCKSWYSLISSPCFVKIHRKFIMCNKKDINTTRIDMIPYHESVPKTPYNQFSRPKWGFYHMWSMGGSSHGLVCLHKNNQIIVTNPLTREFRELAQPPDEARDNSFWVWQCIGFGYDSSTDDYKVVMLTCVIHITFIHILSLKSNIWKLFGQIKYNCICRVNGILFNGALHWFCVDRKSATPYKHLIVSFDLVKEEFREIPQPNDPRYENIRDHKLGLFEGSLCIYMEYNHCEIWVMKNYTDGNSSWELLPITNYCHMKKNAIHYMLKDDNYEYMPPTYYSDDNIHLSTSEEHLSSPIFVQTLVSPYVDYNDNGRLSLTKNNKSTFSTGRSSHAKTNKSNGRPSRAKNNERSVSTGTSSHAKTNKSSVSIGRSSHAQTNKSTVKAWRVKEKREIDEGRRETNGNKHIQEEVKNGSKGKERSLKSFGKKKDRVE